MQITPTVLAENEEQLLEQMTILPRLADRVQVDLSDGTLFPNKTVPMGRIASFCEEHEGNYSNNIFDFHLMVSEWEEAVSDLSELRSIIRINLVLVHQAVYRTSSNPIFRIGIVLNPEEMVERELLKHTAAVQIMTVQPGRQGNPFLPSNLSKIADLRNSGYKGEILIDGGVNEQTLPIVLRQLALPDILAIGSELTKSPAPQAEFKQLNAMVRQY